MEGWGVLSAEIMKEAGGFFQSAKGGIYITGASILLVFNVEVHDFEQPARFLLDGMNDFAERLFVEICLYQ